MLHELALPARSRSAAYQLGHNAARTISASHLWHPFGVVDVPPLCVQWVVVLVGWVTARKEIVGRLPNLGK